MARGLLIHPRLVASLQPISEAAMPETCQVFHRTSTSEGQGGTAEAYPDTTDATVPCRRGPLGNSPQERDIAAKISDVTVYAVSVPVGTVIHNADRLVVGGQTLEVKGTVLTSWALDLRIICAEVTSQ